MSNQINNKKDNFADIRKILKKTIRNWYVFVIMLLIAVGVAYFANRYNRTIYRVTTTVIVKSKSANNSAAQFLYGSDISSDGLGEGIESVIFQSYPIVKRTILELNFIQQFLVRGDLITEEVYGKEPAEIQIDSLSLPKNYGSSFIFIVTDEDHFKFYRNSEDAVGDSKVYEFGKLIDYETLTFRAKKRKNINYKQIIGQEYILKFFHPDIVTNEYSNRLRISPVSQEGSILSLSLNSYNVNKARNFLNKLIEVYTDEELKQKNEIASKTISFIDNRLKEISDSLYLIETTKANYQSRSRAAQIGQGQTSGLISRLENVDVERTQLENKIAVYGDILNTINNSDNYEELAGLSASGVDDQTLRNYISQIVDEQAKIDRVSGSSQNSSTNPLVKRAYDRIDQLKTNIRESTANLRANVQKQKAISDSRAKSIRRDISSVPLAARELSDINRSNSISENLFLLYNGKRAEAEVARASASSDIQMVNPPMPSGAETDNKRNYMIALFLGITLPLGFIILKDFMSNKVYSKDDIEKFSSIPMLGQIWRQGKVKDMLVVNNNPKSVVAESFRSVRSNLNFFTTDDEQKTFVITSSISGEGKTFCSVNLSTVFAFSTKKVVLIGADLRRPKIFGDFGLKNDVGLSNYLAGSAFKSEIIQSTEIPYLDIISSGPVPPNPSELLMSAKMKELINELKKDYDYIIIDTAPLGLVTDALILMNYANHTIFMVRQNYTPLEAIKNVQDLYESGKLKKVSILFNDVKDQGNNYGYGYGYYGDGGKKK